MPSQEEIDQQRALLASYRGNLGHLIRQAVAFGGESAAPLHVINTLEDTRANIRRIKGILRGWGQQVDDQANDEPPAVTQPSTTDTKASAESTTSAPPAFRDIKKRSLERRLGDLIAEYEAVTTQLSSALSEGDRVRLKRQAGNLEQEISQVESDLRAL